MKELKRLVDAVENLRTEVGGLTERMEYTGSLLEGPKAEVALRPSDSFWVDPSIERLVNC